MQNTPLGMGSAALLSVRKCIRRLRGVPALAADALRRALPRELNGKWDPVAHLIIILAFVALLVAVVFPLFLPRTPRKTFSPSEYEAFDHVEAVKKELGEVQAKVGPAKAPYVLTLSGANVPPPPKKPD